MKGTKAILADVLFNSKAVHLFKRLPMRNKLVVLNYHRIRPSDPHFQTEFDDGAYNVDENEFARQVKWLKKNTRLLSEKDLIDLRSGDGGFQRPKTSTPCVIVTFDDGYKDTYTIALPILKNLEAPAILFVATHMINTRQLLWRDVIAYLIKHCTRPFIIFEDQEFSLPDRKNEAISFFQQRIKQVPYDHTKYLLSELSEACAVELPDASMQDGEILTWDEIREMARQGFSIGSHTHTHRALSAISLSAQKEEMILSKLILEEQIGRRVLSIAYPAGEPRFISAEAPGIAETSGYMLGFTANTGVNSWKSVQPYGVRRVARLLDKVSTVSLLTVLPELFAWDSAETTQLKMMETHPTYADAYYRLGIIHLGQGKIDQAVDDFQEAVRFNPNYTEARIKLGLSQAFVGRYVEAESNLKAILDKRPAFADAHYYLGIVYAGSRQILPAIRSLKKAIQINPAYKDAILKLGVLYGYQKRYDMAIRMLEWANRIDMSDSDVKFLVDAGQTIIANHGPDSSSDVTSLFAAYFGSSDQIDRLITGFATSLSISPNLNEIMAIVERGDFPRQNLEALLELFQEYESTFPEYADIRYMLGILYRKLDRFEDAESSFKESLRLNPRYIKARMNLFNLLKGQNRYGEALEHGRALESFNLPYPDLYCGLAEILAELSRYSEAGHYVQRAMALNPAYPTVQQLIQRIREADTGSDGDVFMEGYNEAETGPDL